MPAPTVCESSALGRNALGAMWGDIAAGPGPAVVESFWFAPRDRAFLATDIKGAGKNAPL
ncbi:hypothetical protein [Pseudarthrobacter sp. N5]|uniref:hypothetical protein n=1 Tax=Pseudarthrobacter sp. N5 TaxID=3418416 RepID=UPI003CEB531B